MIFYNDAETFSRADLKAAGTYKYAADPSTEILLLAYAADNGLAQLWSPAEGEPVPEYVLDTYMDRTVELVAHNAMFDRNVIPRALARMGYITAADAQRILNPDRWRCTMVQALTCALPASLDELGRVLGLPASQQKLKEGKALIRRFCVPAPANHKADRYDHRSHPELWERFREYAKGDIVAMRECMKRMPDWNYRGAELGYWRLDQRINDRGFYVDRPLVEASVRATDTEKARMAVQFKELTGYQVSAPSKREQFKAFLQQRFGLELENTQAETLRTVLRRDGLAPELRELLEIAIASNKTSTSKYATLLQAIGEDGRFRGGLQFAGAGRTRRFAGRMYQPQNLPSRGLPKADSVETYIAAVKADVHTVLFDDLMRYSSAALRGVIEAPAGKTIAASDLSNIEGRILAWVAGENWKLDAFRAYDAGTGPDLYNITANMITGVDPWKVPKHMRNAFGKVPDLASGYQGGVAGYQTFAKTYGVRMADHWDTIQTSVAPEHIAKAREHLTKPWARKQLQELEISELEWLASETCKVAWRAKHPATVAFWYALQEAAMAAIQHPGTVHTVTRLRLSCQTHAGIPWLQILLPSGRRLCYFRPELTASGGITYWGMASDEGSTVRAWVQCFTHGGKLTGNVCQTLARDLLLDQFPHIEAAGFPIVLSVHDEVVTEPDAHRTAEELSCILATNPPWAPGLPLAAAGFISNRYKKED